MTLQQRSSVHAHTSRQTHTHTHTHTDTHTHTHTYGYINDGTLFTLYLLFHYQIAVTCRSSVPSFTPDLGTIPAMPHCKHLQNILLTKVINAERAAYHAPKFLKLTVSDNRLLM